MPKRNTPADTHSTVNLDADRYSPTAQNNTVEIAKRCYVDESPIHGKGLFAAKTIKANVTLGFVQGMLTADEGTYVLWLTDDLGIEITNEFRFINHDANPNCAVTDTEVYTLRAVKKGEELTHDYGWR